MQLALLVFTFLFSWTARSGSSGAAFAVLMAGDLDAFITADLVSEEREEGFLEDAREKLERHWHNRR